MGTHPSGPAKLSDSDQILASWLKDKASSVGVVPEGYPANDLPFLFKVLSIRKALSIQVLASID
jgi:mannose-6-phosphate isomerase